MPFERSKYPADWEDFSRRIRFERAKGQCECAGECALHDGHDLFFPVARRCVERHGTLAQYARGEIILTVAHLNRADGPCKCNPLCAINDHVKAMCQRCHIRYDIERHVAHRKRTAKEGAPKCPRCGCATGQGDPLCLLCLAVEEGVIREEDR